MFVWAKIKPEHLKGQGTIDFCLRMMDEAAVALAPGSAFGELGEGYVRIALVENEQRLRQAMPHLERRRGAAYPATQAPAGSERGQAQCRLMPQSHGSHPDFCQPHLRTGACPVAGAPARKTARIGRAGGAIIPRSAGESCRTMPWLTRRRLSSLVAMGRCGRSSPDCCKSRLHHCRRCCWFPWGPLI